MCEGKLQSKNNFRLTYNGRCSIIMFLYYVTPILLSILPMPLCSRPICSKILNKFSRILLAHFFVHSQISYCNLKSIVYIISTNDASKLIGSDTGYILVGLISRWQYTSSTQFLYGPHCIKNIPLQRKNNSYWIWH